MIRKLSFFIGLGAGYVLGAKAGEERYRQIMTKARDFAGMPAVQEAASTLTSAAGTVADKATTKAKETVESLVDHNGSSTPPAVTPPTATPTTATTSKAPVTGEVPGTTPLTTAAGAPRR